jgi:probable HAF family extracellular repeat protein
VVAVSGRTVVGWSEVAGGAHHGFAYDLAEPAATRQMRDLGTLGGTASEATAVSGRLVVGWSEVAGGAHHAVVYDLAVAPGLRRWRDLGTLGGPQSEASAVSGRLVVGWSVAPGAGMHPFAYDLAAPSPSMRDLGTLGGDQGRAIAVNGSVVVGSSASMPGMIHDGDPEAFVIDLRRDRTLRAITGGDRYATATAVTARFVVGYRVSGVERGIVYDVPSGRVYGLTPLGGMDSQATAVSGRVVAGWATTPDETSRAVVWKFP